MASWRDVMMIRPRVNSSSTATAELPEAQAARIDICVATVMQPS
jgi:hypothetical protein